MGISIDWTYLVLAIVINVGIIEWSKGIFKTAPAVLWSALSPIISIGIAFAADGGIYQVLTNGLAIWSLSQLSYQLVLQAVPKLVESVFSKAQGK